MPHRQLPDAEQLSARTLSQGVQAAALTPQVETDGALQVPPEQHPPAQVEGLHPLQEPPKHVWPDGHTWQAAPPAPQAVTRLPETQVFP